jgi:glycosyltransferase involved in cell wall biosynthesis
MQPVCAPIRDRAKPRLLYIITQARRGGAQSHVLGLACSMRRDFEVVIATGEEGFLTSSCRKNGIPVHIVPHLERRIRPPADARAFWELFNLIRRLQPHLIHAHTFKAGFLGRLAGRLLGVPSIYTIHTWLFGTPAMSPLWSALGAPCERLAANCCDRVITVSEAGARLVRSHRIAPQSKVVTIHNGIPDCSERAHLRDNRSPVITMVACFAEVKQHDVLLRAFAHIRPGPRLRLIGDGPKRAISEKLARDLRIQDRVEFLGDRADVAPLLASSDVFVLASQFEMFPLSILEAMRAGLPVIASDVGGVREAVVHGETGFLVPSGSIPALAQALTQIAGNFDLRLHFAHAARQRFTERFVCTQQEERTRSVYLDVLLEYGRVAHEVTRDSAIDLQTSKMGGHSRRMGPSCLLLLRG